MTEEIIFSVSFAILTGTWLFAVTEAAGTRGHTFLHVPGWVSPLSLGSELPSLLFELSCALIYPGAFPVGKGEGPRIISQSQSSVDL